MENLEWILSIAGTALSLLITTVTFAVKFYRKVKEKLATESEIKLTDAILPLIEAAEALTHYNGPEKKEYVLVKANQFAIDNGIDFDPATISAKIEELVSLTKQVNNKTTII